MSGFIGVDHKTKVNDVSFMFDIETHYLPGGGGYYSYGIRVLSYIDPITSEEVYSGVLYFTYLDSSEYTQIEVGGSTVWLGEDEPSPADFNFYLIDHLETKKMKKGWMEVPDKSKILKITSETAIKAPNKIIYQPKAVVYDGKLHVLSTAPDGLSNEMFHYSYDGTQWITEPTINFIPKEATYIVYDDKIHMIGSGDFNFHYTWDGNEWVELSRSLPFNIKKLTNSIVLYNDKIYLIGSAKGNIDIDDWESKTWSGLTSFRGDYIWTDGENIYYSSGSDQYVLDKATSTWSTKTWNGFTNFRGDYIWTDGENIYLSNGSNQYVLNKATSTWSTKTWSGVTVFLYGNCIWTDGENIYYSSGRDQYVLNKATSTWSTKTWDGSYLDGKYIWTDGSDIYYSYNSTQYVLNKATSTWSTKTWSGLTSFRGDYIWTDGENIYYSSSSTQYVLNKATFTWSTKTWDELTSFYGSSIWSDGENNYYSRGDDQYKLVKTKQLEERLFSYDGTSWVLESSSLPNTHAKRASAVTYNGKIHIMGDETDPDGHYAWNGTSWDSYPDMPFNNYGGPVFVDEYRLVPCINVLWSNKHYAWYSGGWWIDDGNPQSTLPYYISDYLMPTAIQFNDLIHLIGGGYDSPTNHYLYNWKEHVWETSIEIKENVQPGQISIYDNLIFDKMLRRVRKAWVGDLNHEPKLVLRSIPNIDNLSSLGCTIPNNMVVGNFNSSRMAAVSFNNRIHVLGGAYDVHYSFAVSYDIEGKPTAIDVKKETPLPYAFQANTVVVLYGRIHIFGSGATIDYRLKHYSYGTDGEWIDECGTSRGPVISNKSIMVQVNTDVYFFVENMITKYMGSTNTWTSVQSTGIPFWIDNAVYEGWQAGIYDNVNNRIIISYYNNGSTYFYAVDLSYSNLSEMAAYGISLIRTVNNAHFLHPLYVDVDVLPNGEDGFIYLFGDQDATSGNPIYKYYDNEWHSYHNMPYPFNDGCSVLYDGAVHILGGSASANRTNHYSWDGGNNWYQEPSLPYKFYSGAAVVYDDKLHILGSGYSNCYTCHYSYDGTSWTQESTLPYDFKSGCAVVYKNKIHILGGTDTDPYTSLNGGTTYHYAWDGTSWSQVSTLPYNFDCGSAVVYNGRIHILGGYDSGNEGFKHYAWGGSSWTQESTLPYNFIFGTACVYMDRIHIMGGMNKSDYTSYSYHYYLHGTVWRSQEDMPYAMSGISSIVVNTPSQKYMMGWTNRGNYDLSYTGLGAFSLSNDPSLSNCIACSWNGIANNYMPAITLTHNYRIFMIDVDGHGGYDGVEPSIYELKMARMNDYFITFNEYDDNVLGKLNVNNLVYDNNDLYTYGGGRDFSFYSGGTNSVYLYKYESARSKGKWAKVNTTYHNDINPMSFGLDGGNENIGLIHEGKIVIFTNATDYNDHNNTIYTREFIMRLIINPSNGDIHQLPFASTNRTDMHSIPNDKLYGLDFNRCYGLFSYNGLIYFLGGAYTPNTNGAYMKITKYNPIKRTLEYVGRIWDTSSNSMVTRHISLPYDDRYPYHIDKFGYGVIGTDLHIIYVQNGTTYHKILDLVTEANYYQFDSKKELPLSEPLRDATAPPSTFCGPCFTYGDCLFAVCKETVGSTIAYKIYYLVEYTEHYVNEDIGLDTYDYACRWDLMFMTYNPSTLKYIMANRYNQYYDPTVEFIYDTDGVTKQVEGTIDEYFN